LIFNEMDESSFNWMTVNQFLAIANTALGGGSTAYSYATLNAIALQLNGSFYNSEPDPWAQVHLLHSCGATPVNTAPTFTSPTPACGSTIEAKVGMTTTFTIKASDVNPGDSVTLNVSGLPAGATVNPSLPSKNNPDSTVFSWTPTSTGSVSITFTATDNSSVSTTCAVTIHVTSCPHGGGYWKNNSSAWPVQSLMLGTVTYTKAQLITILNTPVGRGNNADASLILADQLIPAKLSIAAGAVAPQAVLDSIASANALIGSNTIPMHARPNRQPGARMVAIANFLAGFNNGAITTGCPTLRLASDDNGLGNPSQFSLDQNFPNPFSETTVINYVLPEDSYVHLTIYNFIGEQVATLADGWQEAGYRSAEFNGSTLPAGVYFCRMESGDFSATTKLVLIK